MRLCSTPSAAASRRLCRAAVLRRATLALQTQRQASEPSRAATAREGQALSSSVSCSLPRAGCASEAQGNRRTVQPVSEQRSTVAATLASAGLASALLLASLACPTRARASPLLPSFSLVSATPEGALQPKTFQDIIAWEAAEAQTKAAEAQIRASYACIGALGLASVCCVSSILQTSRNMEPLRTEQAKAAHLTASLLPPAMSSADIPAVTMHLPDGLRAAMSRIAPDSTAASLHTWARLLLTTAGASPQRPFELHAAWAAGLDPVLLRDEPALALRAAGMAGDAEVTEVWRKCEDMTPSTG